MSVRLLVVVEGQTEEGFVRRVLGPHLWRFNVFADAKLVTTRYRRGLVLGKGGGRSYAKWKADLDRLRRGDPNPDRWLTSMIDLYGLARLDDAFPGYAEHCAESDPYARVAAMERAFGADVGDRQFIPYIQLHEYEALLLADPGRFAVEYLHHDEPIGRLLEMAAGYHSPELINEGEHTAPSKRIIRELPEYAGNKPRVGTLVAEKIGIDVLRARCPHFGAWLGRLETLAEAAGDAASDPG